LQVQTFFQPWIVNSQLLPLYGRRNDEFDDRRAASDDGNCEKLMMTTTATPFNAPYNVTEPRAECPFHRREKANNGSKHVPMAALYL